MHALNFQNLKAQRFPSGSTDLRGANRAGELGGCTIAPRLTPQAPNASTVQPHHDSDIFLKRTKEPP